MKINGKYLLILIIIAIVICCSIVFSQTILVEAESFEDLGGWFVDQQSMDQMGSPYILAHGFGEPVRDAVTSVTFSETGQYNVWVRTRDWVGPWKAPGTPGKFRLIVDGKALQTFFGTEWAQWHWQKGGTVTISDRNVNISLHDMTGFDGRCDAIVFTKDPDLIPPNEKEEMLSFRKRLLNLPDEPEDIGQYDLVVVGGGMAGTCTAISAARLGLKVALIQNRPVLGGNNSSEIRVNLQGEINLPPYPALGNVVRELDPGFRGNAQPADRYDDDKKLRVVKAEKNISLFLNTHAFGVEKNGDQITAVLAKDMRKSRELRFKASLFADCTGDATIGFLAGADYRMGREGRDLTAETLAPEKADKMAMGMSVLWYSIDTGKRELFPDCPWAVEFSQESCQPVFRSDWDWEAGMHDNQVTEAEFIRDYSLRVIYGNWAFMKNHSRQKDQYTNHKLDWVAYIGGKRESRRLMGDLILCQQDIQQHVIYPDAFVVATWLIDLHYPDPQNTKHFPDTEFRSIAEFGEKEHYPVPYRCLYSRNVSNLMMAGRNISVTHVALGTTRTMRTCGMMGELLGMASSLCRKYDTSPRSVYYKHLDELKALAKKGVGKLPYKASSIEGFNYYSTTPLTDFVSSAKESVKKVTLNLFNPVDRPGIVKINWQLPPDSDWWIQPASIDVPMQPGEKKKILFDVSRESKGTTYYPLPRCMVSLPPLYPGLDRIDFDYVLPIKPIPLKCKKTKIAPVIDGKIDDPCWNKAESANDFVVLGKGTLTEVNTKLTTLYDEKNLYMAFRCQWPKTGPIKSKVTKRDGKIWNDDNVEIFIDHNPADNSYLQLGVNSLGTIFDQINMKGPSSWNGRWKVKATEDKTGWSVEIALEIASASIPAPKSGTVWDFNACRNCTGTAFNENSSWSFCQHGFHEQKSFGQLVFE
jgi:hypothetical protein